MPPASLRRISADPSANFLQPVGELPPAFWNKFSVGWEKILRRVGENPPSGRKKFSVGWEKILHQDGVILLTGCRNLYLLTLHQLFACKAQGKIGQFRVCVERHGFGSAVLVCLQRRRRMRAGRPLAPAASWEGDCSYGYCFPRIMLTSVVTSPTLTAKSSLKSPLFSTSSASSKNALVSIKSRFAILQN